jgi:transcription antitermination factor NusG
MEAQLYEIGQIVEYVDLIDRGDQPAEFELSETAKWFCAVVNPNCQARASLGLYELGFRTFYPRVRRWVSHARVRKAKEKPLLGRYIFVEIDHPTQSFGSVRSVNGIEGIVSNPDPIQIPSAYVSRLRERYMSGEWDEVAKGSIPIGARVLVVEGEFNDMLATVTSRKHGRLHCKILGTNTYAQMRDHGVRAA